MENRFNNRDFEQFVKQNADQYRMFPSEKVWNNIHNTLHIRRRWYGIGIALLLLSVTTVTFVMLNNPGKDQPIAQTIPAAKTSIAPETKSKQANIFIAPVKQLNRNNSTAIINTDKQQPSIFKPVYNNIISEFENPETLATLATNSSEEVPTLTIVKQTESIAVTSPARTKNPALNAATHEVVQSISATLSKNVITTVVDNTSPDPADHNEQKTVFHTDINLLTIESVVNSYKYTRKPKKLSLQLFVTPSISYRSLKENKDFIRAAQSGNLVPLANLYTPDVNNIVTHKPDIGFQLGITAGYPLSKNITLTGGLQFTVSKYDIKAYNHPSEVTTIALSTAAGGTNTVSAYTNYRNIGGNDANWLHNLYFSASVPVGLELKLTSNKKGYIGVGGNVQPTYVIDNRSYLLSTDFKNYAEIPSLIRRWNINTGFEVFAAHTTGTVKWRIGPQVRYQAMSSFIEKYPVKEHLFDFGIKLGVTLR